MCELPAPSVAYRNLLAEINCRHEAMKTLKSWPPQLRSKSAVKIKDRLRDLSSSQPCQQFYAVCRMETDKNGAVPYLTFQPRSYASSPILSSITLLYVLVIVAYCRLRVSHQGAGRYVYIDDQNVR